MLDANVMIRFSHLTFPFSSLSLFSYPALIVDLEAAQSRIKSLSDEISEKAVLIQTLETEKASLSDQLSTLSSKTAASSDDNAQEEIIGSDLQVRLIKLEEQLKESNESKAELVKEVATLKNKNDLTNQQENFEVSDRELKAHLEDKNQELEELRSEWNDLASKHEVLIQEDSDLKESYSAYKSDKESRLQELALEIHGLKSVIDEKNLKMKEIDEKYWEAKEDVAELETLKEALEEKLEESKSVLEEVESFRSDLKVLEEQSIRDRKKIEELDEINEKLQQQHGTSIREKDDEIKHLKKRSEEDEFEMKKLLSDLKALEIRLVSSNEKVQVLSEANLELKSVEVKLRETLTVGNERFNYVQEQLDNQSSIQQSLQDEILELKEVISHLEEQLQRTNEEAELNDTEVSFFIIKTKRRPRED